MSTLTYDFRVIGLDAIDKAFSSVESRVAKHNQTVTRAMGGRAVTARVATNPEAAAMRLAQRQERETAKAQQQAERARLREVERSLKAEERMRVQSAREAAKKAAAVMKAADREVAAKARKSEAWRQEVGGKVSGAIKSGVGGVSRAALAATGLAGGAWLTATTYGAIKQEENVRRILIGSRGAGERELMTPKELQGKIRGTSIATGVSEEDITGGMAEIVARTGDLKGGIEMMQTLGQVTQATGASFTDLAGVASELKTKFDIKTVDEMQHALAMLTFQGKSGAFEIKNMADEFPKLAARASSLGLNGFEGLTKTGGLLQIIKGATGTAPEAAFGMDAMFRSLINKAEELESGQAFGGRKVNIFADKGKTQMRDVTKIIPELLLASQGNQVDLQEVFQGEGMRGFTNFQMMFNKAGGGAVGAQAVTDAINKASEGGNWQDMQIDFASAMQSTSAQLEVLNTQMKAAVESDLLPALKQLIPELIKMAPAVGKVIGKLAEFIEWASNNPWSGLGAVVATAIAVEIGKAGIASATGKAVSALISGAGSGFGVGAAARGIGSGLTTVGGIIGAGGLAIGAAGTAAVAGTLAAGYEGYQLYKDTRSGWGFDNAKASTPEQYDEIMRKAGVPAPQTGSPAVIDDAASKLADAVAAKIQAMPSAGTSAGTLNRGQSPTNPG